MDEHEAAERLEHPRSGAKYVYALGALLILTGLSFAMSYLELGSAGIVIALVIAGLKVLVVGLVFMELLDSMAATRLVAAVTVLFVVLLCAGIWADVGFR